MPYQEVNGVRLYYEVHGQGDWLVLVHEFSGCAKSWEPQLAVFAQRYRVLVYNCRGYPPSTVPTDLGDYSQELSIEDMRQLMERLDVRRPRHERAEVLHRQLPRRGAQLGRPHGTM